MGRQFERSEDELREPRPPTPVPQPSTTPKGGRWAGVVVAKTIPLGNVADISRRHIAVI